MKYLKPYKRFIVIFLILLLIQLLLLLILIPDKPIEVLGFDIASILGIIISPIGLLSSLLQIPFALIFHDWAINSFFSLPFYLVSILIFAIFIHNIIGLLSSFSKTKKYYHK